MAMALLARLVSIRVGISVALIEIVVGAVAGNIPGSQHLVVQTEFTTFLATLGSAVLTFLAGAEIDPVSLRRHWRVSPRHRGRQFHRPVRRRVAVQPAGAGLDPARGPDRRHRAEYDLGRGRLRRDDRDRAQPDRLRQDDPGRLLRHRPGHRARPGRAVRALQRAARGLRRGHRGRDVVHAGPHPGRAAHGGRPGQRTRDQVLVPRAVRPGRAGQRGEQRSGPAGLLISVPALVSGAGVIALLFGVKMVTKLCAIWPTAAAFHLARRDRAYTTLLMATGLTFGSISALYGLTNHLITQAQYSQLVTVVILSAFVPTLIAQQFFRPGIRPPDGDGELAAGPIAAAPAEDPVP